MATGDDLDAIEEWCAPRSDPASHMACALVRQVRELEAANDELTAENARRLQRIVRLEDVLLKMASEDWRGNKPAHILAAQKVFREA